MHQCAQQEEFQSIRRATKSKMTTEEKSFGEKIFSYIGKRLTNYSFEKNWSSSSNEEKKSLEKLLLVFGKCCWIRFVVTQLLKNVVEGGKPVELNSNGNGFSCRRAFDSAARLAITAEKLQSNRGSTIEEFVGFDRRSVVGDGGGGKPDDWREFSFIVVVVVVVVSDDDDDDE